MPDTRAAFLNELRRVSPAFADAFEQAVQDIRSTAQRRAIEEAIKRAVESGNVVQGVQEVTQALNLGAEFWAPLDRQVQEAFETGAIYQLSTLPKKPLPNTGPLVVRFQGRHPRAEAWTRDHAARLITEISDDTREVIRGLITEAVETSRPYRRVTADLIGRTSGNQLTGGLIGLHSRQAAAVRNARSDLEALSPNYFNRLRRDRSFDGLVRKAIDAGEPLSAADVDRIAGRYSDRLLRLRGETIARTEANKAMNAGRAEAIVQLVERGDVPQDAVSIIWDATPGPRTRDSHRALNGAQIKWGERFVSPVTGATLRWPHDEEAPGAETINCRCSARFRVDYRRVAEWRERFAIA